MVETKTAPGQKRTVAPERPRPLSPPVMPDLGMVAETFLDAGEGESFEIATDDIEGAPGWIDIVDRRKRLVDQPLAPPGTGAVESGVVTESWRPTFDEITDDHHRG
ncbi:hypothetical protein GCM10011335_09440 [Aureimonas glaciei]|uniref:Uncharacterized protein n=1 Tax=Aureimonas glaciei TaxID=1776957 RepID=A0A917D6V0_9HYPH|nr:hypothetical protein GCM10011335_09440 [Aureimonas glaciei]